MAVSPLTQSDLADIYASVEKDDLRVKKVRLHSETLRGLKQHWPKGQKFGKKVWGAVVSGSHEIPRPHVILTDDRGEDHTVCVIHGKDGQLCPDCSTREVMES